MLACYNLEQILSFVVVSGSSSPHCTPKSLKGFSVELHAAVVSAQWHVWIVLECSSLVVPVDHKTRP